jgi:inosine-uridine nucleoside N-ribohydrolase
MSRKIIIDTDPGIDDAMAIFYALAAPELEVIGLTTVFGNAATPICTKNALRLLEIAERADIPVAAGAERPFSAPFHGGADFVHGADGQGDTNLPDPTTAAHQQHAVQFIIDQVMDAPGEITLVALGPLTNVALALLMQPDLGQHVGEIVLMGGNAFCPGNVSPTAEANIWNDAEAADIVFGANCPITMVGLDVTESIFMSPAVLDRIGTFNNPRAQHLSRILPFYRGFYAKLYGETGIHVHDSTTITYLLKPELFKTSQHPVRVETVGLSRGKTWPALGRSDQEGAWANRRKINICTHVDAEAAIATEMAYLQIP